MTDVTTANVFDQIVKLQQQAAELISTNGKPILLQILQPIFDVSPSIESVNWTQYTPYFNDGEPCVFSVNWEGAVRIKNSHDDIGDYEDGHLTPWLLKYNFQNGKLEEIGIDSSEWNEERIALLQEEADTLGKSFYKSYWQSEPGDGKYQTLLLQLFGDGVKVTVFRDGNIQVDEYSHD